MGVGIRSFTCLPTALLFQRPSGTISFAVRFLPTSLLNRRSPVAVSCFLRFYRPLYFSDGLRRPYLSLREERYGRKARLVVASSTSFVLPFGAKAQSFRCSSSPHQTHFVGLWRGPLFALLPRTLLYCSNCGEIVGTQGITDVIRPLKLGGSRNATIFLGSAPQGHFLRRC